MSDHIREAFLRRQYKEGMALAAESDIFDLTPLTDSDPPSRYLAHFSCRGLVRDGRGKIVEFDQFRVGIWFTPDYLRYANVAQSLTYLGPHRFPWAPNIRNPFLCAHIAPGTPLVDLIYVCYELWTWRLFATHDDGLNPAASQWARNQKSFRFPIDNRPLKRRSVRTGVAPAKREEME
ncbi:MAG: hypothetical protein C5B50_02235 [Verrucomicrobia bacterium]|nr:MAG: hypothetical protein C5B50_02235 [Verrucomicrobiota bacterium]